MLSGRDNFWWDLSGGESLDVQHCGAPRQTNQAWRVLLQARRRKYISAAEGSRRRFIGCVFSGVSHFQRRDRLLRVRDETV